MISIRLFSETSIIVSRILELIEDNKLNDTQKDSIYEIVLKLENRTPLQKERFSRYYKIGPYKNDNYNLSNMAELYNCTTSTIKYAISTVTFGLFRISDNELQILEQILQEYHEKIGIPNVRFEFDERRNIIYELLKVAKQNILNNEQKLEICKILDTLKDKSDIQLRRFILFYNLQDNENTYRISDIAKMDSRTSNAIQVSINRVKSKLIRVKDEQIYILQNILEECKREYDIKSIDE